jgi:hypothetical protein
MRQGPGHADEPDFASRFEFEQCLHRTIVLEGLPGWRDMELHHVEVIGLHAGETLFDTRHDIFSGEQMRTTLAARRRRRADQATALAGKVITVATM